MEINVINSERVHELPLSDGELLMFLGALGSSSPHRRRKDLIEDGVKEELMDELPSWYLIYRALLSHCKSVGLVP